MNDITKMNFDAMLPVRAASSHKGTFGRLTIVAGSSYYRGAAVLSSLAALRAGAGIVRLAGIEEVLSVALNYDPSMIVFPLEKSSGGCIAMQNSETIIKISRDSNAMLVGCGLGSDDDIKILVREIIGKYEKNLVLDADAINAVSETGCDLLKMCAMTPVITPHIGEMARLTGESIGYITKNPEQTAGDFSRKYSCITVLKGSKTVISDTTGEIYVLDRPNPALATAGSGDVLAGLIAGILVQGISPVESVILGTYIHSEAGRLCAEKYSTYSTTAKDILNEIPRVFTGLGR